MTTENIVTDSMIEEAYITMARIIRDHGDKYLPVFRRLHEEQQQRLDKRDLKNIALQAAQKTAD